MAMAAMNMVSEGGVGGKLSFKKMSAEGSPVYKYFARKPPFLGPDDQS
jgi:hypothetical protein